MLTVSSISLLSSVSVCKRFSDNAGQNFLPTGSVALVADCGRISFQTVRWLMRETNLAERASTAINATQC